MVVAVGGNALLERGEVPLAELRTQEFASGSTTGTVVRADLAGPSRTE